MTAAKVTLCLWYDGTAEAAAKFYAQTFPDSSVGAVMRAHLLALPAVVRCIDDARPYRHYFPLGAPDRD